MLIIIAAFIFTFSLLMLAWAIAEAITRLYYHIKSGRD